MSLIVDGSLGLSFGTPIGVPGGRLTLVSNTPVMSANVAATNTIYYTPYLGALIPIFDGSLFRMQMFGELFALSTDTAKSPAAIGASKVNDWFVWNDAGTLRLSHGPDWTNSSTRSAGTALTRVNGIWLNAASITNGPAAQRGTYVGTTISHTNSLFIWTIGVSAGGPAWLYVWNMYNRVNVSAFSFNPAGSATYSSGAPGSYNIAIVAVFGLVEDPVFATLTTRYWLAAGYFMSRIGVDGYNIFSASSDDTFSAPNLQTSNGIVTFHDYLGLGQHWLQDVRYGDNSNVCTVYLSRDSMMLALLRM